MWTKFIYTTRVFQFGDNKVELYIAEQVGSYCLLYLLQLSIVKSEYARNLCDAFPTQTVMKQGNAVAIVSRLCFRICHHKGQKKQDWNCMKFISSWSMLKMFIELTNTRVYPKVSGLAAWSENCKWYSSLPLGAAVSLFCESVQWVLQP
jgi:hypothetical protein